MKNKEIKLIALDLDGTLLTDEKKVTPETAAVLKEAKQRGIYVVASTGRPYAGLPLEILEEAGIEYAITANGAAIYTVPERKCLFADGISPEQAEVIVAELLEMGAHTDIFIDGQGYGDKNNYKNIERLGMPEVMKEYMRTTRIYIDDLLECIREKNQVIQKITTNYYLEPDGTYLHYEEAVERFVGREGLDAVSGGFHNLEITKKGVTKGKTLQILAEILGVDMSETMACGDSENDVDILRTAAIGVAMANAEDCVKEIADCITLSNEEDGVAEAIRKLVFRKE